jgi:signal transduction histidine kinase
VVRGDAERPAQVAWNLVSNAVKFTPAGGSIEVRLARTGRAVTLVVSDSGVGIAPDVLPHVFDRFHQADGGLPQTYSGLGVGLAIVRHLVELHRGRVRAESAGVGRGSTFSVEVPIGTIVPRGGVIIS